MESSNAAVAGEAESGGLDSGIAKIDNDRFALVLIADFKGDNGKHANRVVALMTVSFGGPIRISENPFGLEAYEKLVASHDGCDLITSELRRMLESKPAPKKARAIQECIWAVERRAEALCGNILNA